MRVVPDKSLPIEIHPACEIEHLGLTMCPTIVLLDKRLSLSARAVYLYFRMRAEARTDEGWPPKPGDISRHLGIDVAEVEQNVQELSRQGLLVSPEGAGKDQVPECPVMGDLKTVYSQEEARWLRRDVWGVAP